MLSTKIPVKILRLIIDSYIRQSTRISWDNVYTNYFQLLNGVKQGSVLSAKLFTLYIDGLFTELKQSCYGCHINNTYMGALSYADDTILSCPSIRGLNRMIKICYFFLPIAIMLLLIVRKLFVLSFVVRHIIMNISH